MTQYVILAAMRTLTLLLVSLVSMSAYSAPLASVALPEIPSHFQDALGFGVWLDLDRTMAAEGLTRAQTIEAQNFMRDELDAKPRATAAEQNAAYQDAVRRVRAGEAESGWKPVEFKNDGDYVVALDMDETLLIQWYRTGIEKDFADLKNVRPDNVPFPGLTLRSPTTVSFAPGAEVFIERLKKDPNCKAVVIFSAKEDSAANDLVDQWKFKDGKSIRAHVDGVFTRNHLMLQGKHPDPKVRNAFVTTPSKDLRIFDPTLKHVVIVDDNPGRIFQQGLLRPQPKYDADRYFEARGAGTAGDAVVKHYEAALKLAADEIIESAKAANAAKIKFSQAFAPYSYAGERIFRTMLATFKSRPQAIAAARANPGLNEAVFFPAPAVSAKP